MLLAGALPESAARAWAEREFACAVRESGTEHWAELSRAVAGGTAVAAPAHALGLIALWDDGDGLHVEQHAPGVHTRDLALLRRVRDRIGC